MMSARRIAIALAGLGSMVLFIAGCRAPGKPRPGPAVIRPDQVLDFTTLYKENCAACHGEDGHHGNAVSLANPVYLAIAGRDALYDATAKGGPGKLMPAFARSQGGELTDRQIEILVDGIERSWGRPGLLAGANPPPYAATTPGNAIAGQADFTTYCARCHGVSNAAAPAGAKEPTIHAGPVTGPDFLALISDQSLRTTILSGRPDEGMPDWRGFATQPLTDQQVTDIVAWLATKRQSFSGPQSAKTP
jgi:cytochrome c oxidase cbb3-type subunit 3/ubiquinol-cytochrome c reductase cytochrome c subunit